MVTGARKVGKTTMLRQLAAGQERTYVTIDNAMIRMLAKTDPVLFFQDYKPPMIIDEIQKAPELFEQIKIICDNSEERGLFWLTGSQQYSMMGSVRETLAGRIGILNMYSLSKNEIDGIEFADELDFSLPALLKRQSEAKKMILWMYLSIFGVAVYRMFCRLMRNCDRNISIPILKHI